MEPADISVQFVYVRLQVINIPKSSAENTTLTLTDVNGTMRTVGVPQGTNLTLDVPGLHYNRKILITVEKWNDGLTHDDS